MFFWLALPLGDLRAPVGRFPVISVDRYTGPR